MSGIHIRALILKTGCVRVYMYVGCFSFFFGGGGGRLLYVLSLDS